MTRSPQAMVQSRTFWLAACLAIVAALGYRTAVTPAEAVAPPPNRIALITGGPGDYWSQAVAGAEAAAKELGIELDVRSPTDPESVEQQMQLLSVVGSAAVDAVAISPIDAERQAELITRVATIKPVVTFDSDASNSARHGYVGTSNFSAGLVAGTLVKKAIPDGGKVAVFLANSTKENLVDRLSGLRTRLAESPVPEESAVDPRYSLVSVFEDQGDDEACEKKLRELVGEHPDLKCVVTLNSRQGPVVLATLDELELAENVRLIAFDTPPETLAGIAEGKVYAAVAQDSFSYGYEAVRMLNSLCRGDKLSLPVVGRAGIHIGVEPVTLSTLEGYKKRLDSRQASTQKERG